MIFSIFNKIRCFKNLFFIYLQRLWDISYFKLSPMNHIFSAFINYHGTPYISACMYNIYVRICYTAGS